MSIVSERQGHAGSLACWAPNVDLVAVVSDRQLSLYRLSWQRLWAQRCDAEVRALPASTKRRYPSADSHVSRPGFLALLATGRKGGGRRLCG